MSEEEKRIKEGVEAYASGLKKVIEGSKSIIEENKKFLEDLNEQVGNKHVPITDNDVKMINVISLKERELADIKTDIQELIDEGELSIEFVFERHKTYVNEHKDDLVIINDGKVYISSEKGGIIHYDHMNNTYYRDHFKNRECVGKLLRAEMTSYGKPVEGLLGIIKEEHG